MRVYFWARGLYGYVDLSAGWPGPGVPAVPAGVMAQTTIACPVCPDVPTTMSCLRPPIDARHRFST